MKSDSFVQIINKYGALPLTWRAGSIMINLLGAAREGGEKKYGLPLDISNSFCYYSFAHGGIAQLGARVIFNQPPV